ncbi:alpha,alpha-trehalase TreF [Sphingomonas suaedae]|uniref:alpha,alpha-trehalase TreF n=1 Tax=Sphingomonas suaedae TaxID=2599297 RepID=UPI001EEFD848|nr:alpha,alpha-trehalase TreF [Sphingomonas suaedae]
MPHYASARVTLAAALLALAPGCATSPLQRGEVSRAAIAQSPAQLFGPLFVEVQMRRLFADGKTFVDAVPRRDPRAILADYRVAARRTDAELRAFVQANFDLPAEQAPVADQPSRPSRPLLPHIRALWDDLARPPVEPEPGGSALAFDGAHVVPGGRFREIYYWDSYFTMLGLREDGRRDLIEGMVDGFVALVERHGHVPNGARSYYLSRSQPPFLYAMMDLSDMRDPAVLGRRLDALIAEHDYWMRGGRVVTMADGALLNRYWDDLDTPRDESFREDVETARASGRPAATVYRHLRAAAESGWDFSSRWLADGRTLATIDTTDLVPADLNSLLYGMERAIAARCRVLVRPCAASFERRADARRQAVERWLWDDAEGRYGDYDRDAGRIRPGLSAVTAYPLFTRLASPQRAARVAATIDAKLIAPGGLRTTRIDTGQQWDAPNGWAPLQWIAADGLLAYGHDGPARRIAARWVATVQRGYQSSGKLVEKYDVETVRPGGGGEYPLQDGFGWTNGVTRAMMARWGIGD